MSCLKIIATCVAGASALGMDPQAQQQLPHLLASERAQRTQQLAQIQAQLQGVIQQQRGHRVGPVVAQLENQLQQIRARVQQLDAALQPHQQAQQVVNAMVQNRHAAPEQRGRSEQLFEMGYVDHYVHHAQAGAAEQYAAQQAALQQAAEAQRAAAAQAAAAAEDQKVRGTIGYRFLAEQVGLQEQYNAPEVKAAVDRFIHVHARGNQAALPQNPAGWTAQTIQAQFPGVQIGFLVAPTGHLVPFQNATALDCLQAVGIAEPNRVQWRQNGTSHRQYFSARGNVTVALRHGGDRQTFQAWLVTSLNDIHALI